MVPNNVKICDHEADPATIEYDKKYGRKAICKKCGAKLWITKFVQPRRKYGKSV